MRSSFNPRTREGCDSPWVSMLCLPKRFNPRTREGCDCRARTWRGNDETRFNPRTREGCDLLPSMPVRRPIWFQSTHPRGVRHIITPNRTPQSRFNPRTREGCDWTAGYCRHIDRRFNPRTREGCDQLGNFTNGDRDWFQSTHPRGVRPVVMRRPCRGDRSFNPRTREGCDLVGETGEVVDHVFQSTHPRGVRQSIAEVDPDTSMFQSTHPRGVRRPC